MNKWVLLSIMMVSMTAFSVVHASSVVFSRDTITIASTVDIPVTSAEATDEEAAADGEESSEPETVTTTRQHRFSVNIEHTATGRPDWFLDRGAISGTYGTLYMLETAAPTQITTESGEDLVDIFFIDSHGYILTIAKSITPNQLAQPITVDKPVKALLYLAGGTAERYAIAPQDRVLHTLFPDRPVLEE